MGTKYEYEGEVYYYRNNKWIMSNYCEAPLAIASKLSHLFQKKSPITSTSTVSRSHKKYYSGNKWEYQDYKRYMDWKILKMGSFGG